MFSKAVSKTKESRAPGLQNSEKTEGWEAACMAGLDNHHPAGEQCQVTEHSCSGSASTTTSLGLNGNLCLKSLCCCHFCWLCSHKLMPGVPCCCGMKGKLHLCCCVWVCAAWAFCWKLPFSPCMFCRVCARGNGHKSWLCGSRMLWWYSWEHLRASRAFFAKLCLI